MTRRDFILKASAAISTSLVANPTRSSVGGRGFSLVEDPNPPTPLPYVTDGLVSMWDGIWNAGVGHTDSHNRMVELCGNCGDMEVISGSATFGQMVEFDGMLQFACADMLRVNECIKAGVYDADAGCTISMVVDLTETSQSAYDEGIVIQNYGASGSYQCFYIGGLIYRSLNLLRGRGTTCTGSNFSQGDLRSVSNGFFCVNVYTQGMYYTTEFLNGSARVVGNKYTTNLASRLPNEPSLVERMITTAEVKSFTGVQGAKFGRMLVYDRILSEEESYFNYLVDVGRFLT